MRILHLGFEHPLMPGAGGGSRRTHEIDRRIAAAGHDVVVLTTTYPGARESVVDGVRYIPVGWGRGRSRWTRLLGYVAGLPGAVRRHRRDADLVVEDFFAPFSSMAVPRWSGRPTVGVVQWLQAQEHQRFHLLQQNEASDWADIMPRSGFVLYTNTLWYRVKLLYDLPQLEETRYQFAAPFVVDDRAFVRTFGMEAAPIQEAIRETVAWYRNASIAHAATDGEHRRAA